MAKAKYRIEDFLKNLPDKNKEFVTTVNEILLQKNYKPKLQVTKSTGFQLSYCEPKIKTVTGIILILFVQNDKLMIRIYGKNHEKYSHILNDLPKRIVSQIEKADVCKKSIDSTKCWTGCIGYNFYIRGKHYQKCLTNCFQFEVDFKSIPYFFKLIESECKERCAV